MEFSATNHLLRRMAERGISYEKVKNAIRYPEKVEDLNHGRHGGRLKNFYKKIDGKTLRVGAEVSRGKYWIATAFYET